MKYSLDKISTARECNDLLMQAQRKRQTLDRKRRNLGESIGDFRKRLNRIEKELADVRSSLAALTPAYHAMPEGKDKATINIMIKRLELRQARLEKQAYTCNVASLLVKELRYNALDSQVSAMDDYVDILERTKTALSQSVMYVSQGGDLLSSASAQQSPQHAPAPPDVEKRQLGVGDEADREDEKDHRVLARSLQA